SVLLTPPPPRPTRFPYTTLFRSNHYRSDWSFTEEQLSIAEARLQAWKHAAKCESECRQGLREHIIGLLREALTDDLDSPRALGIDRKSTRLNSSHVKISYAVFCL